MFIINSLLAIILEYLIIDEKDYKTQEIIISENIKKCHRGLLRSFWHWVWESDSSVKFTDDEVDRCFYGRGGGKTND